MNQSPEPVCVVWIVNWEVHRLNGANGRSWQEIECGVSISVSGYWDNLRTVLSTTRTGQTVCLFVCFEYFYCIYNNTCIQRVWTKVFTPKNKYDKIWHNKDMNYTLQSKNGHTVVDIWFNVKYRFVKVSLYVSKEVRLGCNIAINLNFDMNSKSLHFNANSEGIWQKCVFHRMSDCLLQHCLVILEKTKR